MSGRAFSVSRRVQRLLIGDGLRAQLLRGGIGSVAVKAGHAVLALAVAVVLARKLGPEDYGVYSFAIAILMLTAIPAQAGVPQLIIRETAKAQADGAWGLMRGLWRWGNIAVAGFSALALMMVGGILLFTNIGGDSPRVATLVVGLALIPLISLANLRGACLHGLCKVVQGQLPESIIRPALLLMLVGLWTVFITPDEGMTAQQGMGLYVIAAVITFVIGVLILRWSRPAELSIRPESRYESSAWRKSVIPLALISGLQLINNYADLIILGIFRTDEEVGIYRAVFQISLLVVFGIQAINQVVMPHFSRLHAVADHTRFQRLVTMSARLSFVFASIISVVFVAFGDNILSSVFGPDYSAGYVALSILVYGQLLAVAIGFGWTILNMTGREISTFRAVGIGALLNILLNILLIVPFGMFGAAIATSVSLVTAKWIGRQSAKNLLSLETSVLSPNRLSNL